MVGIDSKITEFLEKIENDIKIIEKGIKDDLVPIDPERYTIDFSHIKFSKNF